MEAVTKASQIMALHAQGLSTREIALEVYGEAIDKRMAYVRIVVRQRKGGTGITEATKRWQANNPRTYRAMRNKRHAERYATEPVFKLRAKKRAQLHHLRQKLGTNQLQIYNESGL